MSDDERSRLVALQVEAGEQARLYASIRRQADDAANTVEATRLVVEANNGIFEWVNAQTGRHREALLLLSTELGGLAAIVDRSWRNAVEVLTDPDEARRASDATWSTAMTAQALIGEERRQ